MHLIVQILTGFLLLCITYWWVNLKKHEKKLKWVRKAPGSPIFGNLMELGKSTETLQVLSRYLKQCNGLCLIDLIVTKVVLISDVKLLEFLLTSTKILNKSSEYRFLHSWLGDGLLTSEATRWRKSRKIITPAFHFSILKEFISVYETNADIMVKLLSKEIGHDSLDIYPYVTMCSLDIICETSMGTSVNAQINRQSEYVYAVKGMCRILVDRSFSVIKRSDILYSLTKDYYKELKYVKILHSYTNSVIQSRKKELKNKISESDSQDDEKSEIEVGTKKKVAFLDLLLQANSDGKPLPDWYIREEVDTLMFEGHDTTGSAMSFALYCLAENPKVQEQAIEEQKKIFANDKNRPTTFEDIHEMKYLELVIKETLRMYPSVPFYARRTDSDIEYKNGQIFPKGTSLVLFPYGLHRNPEIFPEPEKFDPTRFEKMDRTSPFVYLPFSAGARNCIGQKFAMQEMKVVVSKVLRNFVLSPAIPKHDPLLASETVLKSTNGIKIRIKRRNWD